MKTFPARKTVLLYLVLQIVSACSTLSGDIEPLPEQFALPAASAGQLADVASLVLSNQTPEHSGFHLLHENAEALTWRLALIDEAAVSLDLMYYLWHADSSGLLLLKRTIQAADRGVKVRMIVDDLLLIGDDRTLVALDAHPNIQFRIFNPWKNRQLGRGLEFATRMNRLNARMHNKLLIADNHAAILGGRNIGDHYFGMSENYNFHDLDVLGIGPIARQASGMFDHYWNSSWVISASALPGTPDDAFVAGKSEQTAATLQASTSLQDFPLEPQDWDDALSRLAPELHYGTSEFIYDRIDEGEVIGEMAEPLRVTLKSVNQEILLVNAYLLPDKTFIDGMHREIESGVDIRILTNSLASHDVPAVNSHYQKWRKPILESGAELYELRPDAAIKSQVDTAPTESEFIGLHTKAFVVDRQSVFIGSMNFDPRSLNINTEMGVLIESPGLGERLAELISRDMDPANAWQVQLDPQGKLIWENSDEALQRQPARSLWQRIKNFLFKVLPESQV